MRESELTTAREQLVATARQLVRDGLAIGAAGNLSVRAGDQVLITPAGVGYDELSAADICLLGSGGNSWPPSSETPMHVAIYRDALASAVVHTHSPEVIALSATGAELPAIHYAITELGGPVPVTAYRRFGSDALAGQAAAVLAAGHQAVILQNHGAVTIGDNLGQAYHRALLLEWLARVYRLARSLGTPRLLTAAELDEVTAHARRIRCGSAGPEDPAGQSQNRT